MYKTALPSSMLKTSTAFPAMQTARIVKGQTQMTALTAAWTPLSSTMACVLKSALKGLTMKKPLKTVKVGNFCFPQNPTEIEVGLTKDNPKRAYVYPLLLLSVS